MAQRRPKDETEETDSSETPLDEVTATYVPCTALGRCLMHIRAEIVRSGVPLLSWDDVEREVAERRGGTILREYEERHEARPAPPVVGPRDRAAEPHDSLHISNSMH